MRAHRFVTMLVATALFATLSLACSTSTTDPPTDPVDAGSIVVVETPVAQSTRNHLLWKRARAFEQGIGESLLLSKDEVCKELGRASCVDDVHLVALGGNDPFQQGMHEPLAEPTATTPIAVERIALSACQTSVAKDAARAVPLLFLDLDLRADAPAFVLDDSSAQQASEDAARRVGQRLLARDLSDAELHMLSALRVDEAGTPVQPREYAISMCFALATLTEVVFF
jgi:hypothetical protein